MRRSWALQAGGLNWIGGDQELEDKEEQWKSRTKKS